jgi:hypothetical protein
MLAEAKDEEVAALRERAQAAEALADATAPALASATTEEIG